MVVTLAIDLDLAESEDFRFHVLAIGRNHGHTLAVLTNPRCIVLLVLVAGGAALAQPNLEAPASPRLGGIKFIWIPTGSFQMGSQAGSAEIESRYGGEARFFGVEHPRHGVRLTRGFWLGSCPVLNEQFEIFVKATGYRTEAEREGWGLGYDGKIGHSNKVNGLAWQHPGHRIQARQPVVMVSWNDAQAYIRWLNGGGEEGYRLPTEAEWECACRAGSASAYSFGDDASRLGEYAWFAQNAGYVTHPAGQKKPNPWGLYDMHGNVWEWCQDWMGDYPSGSVVDPKGPASGQYRVLRGGSWHSPAVYCRSANRRTYGPDSRNISLGFRLAR
ncbi:MAG TPA: formylglycine-generating enzyme family protein [Dongiaceae bacterium]|nr:formylglycine-generating enzyme family protein [Dongiaceae bacterium]